MSRRSPGSRIAKFSTSSIPTHFLFSVNNHGSASNSTRPFLGSKKCVISTFSPIYVNYFVHACCTSVHSEVSTGMCLHKKKIGIQVLALWRTYAIILKTQTEWVQWWVEVSVWPSDSYSGHIVSSGTCYPFTLPFFSPCLPLLISPNVPYFYFPLIYRQGAGPRGILATLSQYMLGSAASFAFFLSIGSVRSLFRLMIYILAFLSNYMANR